MSNEENHVKYENMLDDLPVKDENPFIGCSIRTIRKALKSDLPRAGTNENTFYASVTARDGTCLMRGTLDECVEEIKKNLANASWKKP